MKFMVSQVRNSGSLMMRVIWKHSLDCCGVHTVPIDAYLREYLELTLRGLRNDVPAGQGSAG